MDSLLFVQLVSKQIQKPLLQMLVKAEKLFMTNLEMNSIDRLALAVLAEGVKGANQVGQDIILNKFNHLAEGMVSLAVAEGVGFIAPFMTHLYLNCNKNQVWL